jgi:hypothetical protein
LDSGVRIANVPSGRVLSREIRCDPRGIVQLNPAEEDTTEVEAHQHDQQQNRKKERELRK